MAINWDFNDTLKGLIDQVEDALKKTTEGDEVSYCFESKGLLPYKVPYFMLLLVAIHGMAGYLSCESQAEASDKHVSFQNAQDTWTKEDQAAEQEARAERR